MHTSFSSAVARSRPATDRARLSGPIVERDSIAAPIAELAAADCSRPNPNAAHPASVGPAAPIAMGDPRPTDKRQPPSQAAPLIPSGLPFLASGPVWSRPAFRRTALCTPPPSLVAQARLHAGVHRRRAAGLNAISPDFSISTNAAQAGAQWRGSGLKAAPTFEVAPLSGGSHRLEQTRVEAVGQQPQHLWKPIIAVRLATPTTGRASLFAAPHEAHPQLHAALLQGGLPVGHCPANIRRGGSIHETTSEEAPAAIPVAQAARRRQRWVRCSCSGRTMGQAAQASCSRRLVLPL
ncbi:g7438 [Coccomyxa elongata]